MLGNVADAEDVMQETYLRWLRAGSAAKRGVRSPKAYLSTAVIRLCLDRLRAAPAWREGYVCRRLPEPPPTEEGSVEEYVARLDGSLSTAFLVALESLTPTERAVFVLRKVFGHDHAEVASLVGESEAACHQAVRRAKRFVAARRPRFESSSERKDQPR